MGERIQMEILSFFSAADLSGACPKEASVSKLFLRDLTGGRGLGRADIGRRTGPEPRALTLPAQSGACRRSRAPVGVCAVCPGPCASGVVD